ncbi:MAG: hypothetical protein JW937_09065 [Candidatus Omnitrophica bacterium]|nr:hypothetical protein [Candidatus Omnitrophota bacterium]
MNKLRETLLRGVGDERGHILILSYMAVSFFLLVSATLFSKAIVERNLTFRSGLQSEVFYLAEGAIDNAIATVRGQMATGVLDPGINVYNHLASFQTSELLGLQIPVTVTALDAADRVEQDGATTVLVRNYDVAVSVGHPDNPNVSVTMHQIIGRRLISPFQFSAYYSEDLEILPGPPMTLAGRVHSNKDIYLGANNTLTLDTEQVRAAGEIYNRRKDDTSVPGGDVEILVAGSSPAVYEEMNGLDSSDPDWLAESLNRWNGSVQTASHGVTEMGIPKIESIQKDGYYAGEAGLTMTDGVLYRDGFALIEGVDYPPGTVSTSTSVFNFRENTNVHMDTVNLSMLAGYAPGDPPNAPSFPNNLPANGLIYASRADSGLQPGIRLVGGQEIHRAGGLTVVTEDPVYIQGDFNSTNKKAVSVISDAINIFSNDWDDSHSAAGISSRRASETTVNAAFMSGIEITQPGVYNGGLENYPRFHENWSGIDFNFTGSFTQLWESAIAEGVWGSASYSPPDRNWSYDPAFNDRTQIPPYSPYVVEIVRIGWWKE